MKTTALGFVLLRLTVLCTSRPEVPKKKLLHEFVQLADPQLGMLNMYDDAGNWKEELQMFKGLCECAATGNYAFIFLGGDMQNLWPNEKDSHGSKVVGRNRDAQGQPKKQEDELLSNDKLGEMQRQAVKTTLSDSGLDTKFRVIYTAGNHDVGDVPDGDTLAKYEEWGPHFEVVFEIDGILYLQFNSQLYWRDPSSDPNHESSAEVTTAKSQQTIWLEKTLSQFFSGQYHPERLVILTHIPPFMESEEEDEGWGNWAKLDRLKILDMLVQHLPQSVPVLWVCGHFHTNVENKRHRYKGLQMDVVVTSASGTAIWWGGEQHGGLLSPHEASEVASKPIGAAFGKYIMNAPGGRSSLLQATRKRSGMRTFKMWSDGTVTSEWRTVDDCSRSEKGRAAGAVSWLLWSGIVSFLGILILCALMYIYRRRARLTVRKVSLRGLGRID